VINGLLVLLLCQLVGEVLARSLGLPVPGPVVGMLVLFVLLQVRRPIPDSGLVRGPVTLLTLLPLLYVPVGVGVIAYLSTLRAAVVPVTVALVLSWFAGLVVTAAVAALVLRLTGQARVSR
jgi:holin-like protein